MIKNKKYYLFDLDGTVADSKDGIVNSFLYAFQKLGIKIESRESLFKFIGPPLRESFKSVLNNDEELVEKAVSFYLEYMNTKGMHENSIYQGIEEVFIKLKKNHKNIIIATSKNQILARKIMEEFNLDKYCTDIVGSNLDGTRASKDEVIIYAITKNNINKDSAIMIGDRFHDILGAKNVGMDSIYVLYGYGDREEIKDLSPLHVVSTVGELLDIVG